ncbi:keratin-associated protein 4-12-like [Amphibalanus amphitrite]|uniref:keratin-associated protein 4-12-like n=1 Tax=Amphibalanus amphitrite TaxID=1232801 RepID=UPI001C904218|nr:keratin-associated protein 4-12-like [Amphibalanus amphitrite]
MEDYCDRDHHCAPRRGVGTECDLSVQCLGGACRDGRCKLDRCPEPGSTQDCDPGQFCASGPTGNACRPQLRDGDMCGSDAHCLSHLCDWGRCVRHECRKPFGVGQCLHHQFCEPTLRGNVCSERLARGARCDSDQACQSGACRSGLCFSDQCPQPMTELGCGPLEYCSRDLGANTSTGATFVSNIGDVANTTTERNGM